MTCACPAHDGSESWHGMANGYHWHGCRCDGCKRAHADAARAARIPHPRVIRWPELRGLEGDAWRQAYHLMRRAHYTAHTARRRAAMRGNGVEPYRYEDIFDRDGWVCQLCLKPVDPTVPRTRSRGATIDHVIPVSRGGADTPGNVQLAHFGCNARKRARLPAQGVPV